MRPPPLARSNLDHPLPRQPSPPLASPPLHPSLCLSPQVLRLEVASEFSEPVDLKAFPDYTAEVPQPMDLGTVQVGRPQQGRRRCAPAEAA